MKLLLENWREYLKENTNPSLLVEAPVATYEATLPSAIAALEDHVSAEGGGLYSIDAELLVKTDDPKVVKYSGTAYRGMRIDKLRDLLGMLNDPSFGKLEPYSVITGEIPWFNDPMLEAIKNPGKWVEIIPPDDTKVTVEAKSGQRLVALSFTKSFERAQVFASGQDEAAGETVEFFKGTPNLEVIFVTLKGEPPFIDVNETLAKNINHFGRPFEPEFPEDVEVLSIGDRAIDKILIKVKPGVEDSALIQDMLRWINMAQERQPRQQPFQYEKKYEAPI